MEDYEMKSKRRIESTKKINLYNLKKNLPHYMIKTNVHEKIKLKIEEYNILNKLLDDIRFDIHYNNLITDINEIIRNNSIDYNYCISGSKAWYNIFKDFYDNNYISEYEKSAIHNYNTCDHYYFIKTDVSNNKQIIEKIIQQINELIIILQEELNNQIKLILIDSNKYVQLSIKSNIDDNNLKCLLFKESIILTLNLQISDDIPNFIQKKSRKPRKTIAEIRSEENRKKKELEELRTAAKTAREERARRRRQGGTGAIYVNKNILSFEIDFKNNELIENTKELIIDENNHYLNIYGLYLFLQFGKSKYYIKKGIYNVFKAREYIYDNLILIDKYKIAALFKILDIYEKIFLKYNIPNEYLHGNLIKSALSSHSDMEKFINESEEIIINRLRPYINQTIYNINEDIKKLKFKNNYGDEIIGNKISGIFVLGGDAIKRYDFDSTTTKDIDAKIYIPGEINLNDVTNYYTINNCIVEHLFKLLSFLIINEKTIFSDLNLSKIIDDSNFKCTANFKLLSENHDFLNFRFRQSPKNQFPVDLYSLDYRCIVEFEYSLEPGVIINKKYNHDIAFIDIVIQQSTENNYEKYALISNGVPISSLDFLIDDLKNIYNNDLSSLLRFIVGKSKKDYNRFIILNDIKKNHSKYYTINPEEKTITFTDEKKIFLDKMTDYRIHYNDEIKKYYDLFNKKYKKFCNANDIIKRKIVFKYDKDDIIRGGNNIYNKKGGMKENNDSYIYIEKDEDIQNYEKTGKLVSIQDKDIIQSKKSKETDDIISLIIPANTTVDIMFMNNFYANIFNEMSKTK